MRKVFLFFDDLFQKFEFARFRPKFESIKRFIIVLLATKRTMDSSTQKSTIPKRMPSSLFERNLKTTNLLVRIGLQTSGDMISDIFKGKTADFNKSLLSKKNIFSTVETLKQLRGAAMKFGQLVSIDSQIIFTPEISKIVGQLRSSGYSMPPSQIKKILDKNWGKGWLKNFESFQVHPFAAASIGQVHRAKLKNGPELAIKIQFPNIRETIKNDMRTLRFLLNRSSLLPKGFNADYYFEICEEQLLAESEYTVEAKNIKKYSNFFKDYEHLKVPTVVSEYSTDQILSMSYEEGSEFSFENSLSKSDRNRLVEVLIQLLLDEIFIFQFVQTDPNLANFLLKSEGFEIVLLDFGSCTNVTSETKNLYADLLDVGLTLDRKKIKNFLFQKGFLPDEMDMATNNLINQLIDTAIDELARNDNFDFASSKIFELIELEQLKEFQKIIPQTLLSADFVFIQRKILGFLLFFKSIEAKVPILKILEKYSLTIQNK